MAWLAGFIGLSSTMITAAEFPGAIASKPRIALIIDDLGNHRSAGEAALALPGPLTYAFLPHTPFAREQADKAHAQDKEVMLHLPMESHHGERLGEGGLTLKMPKV
ncbi:MAG: divergent polysaccharide deacetylase family protein, partial [Pseudomonadota bacterium]